MKSSAFLIAVFLFVGIDGEELLSGRVQIKSVKTGKVLGLGTVGNGANVIAKDKLANDKWELEPSTNPSDPFYFISNDKFKWDHKNGCHETDTNLIIWNTQSGAANNKFFYNSNTQLITVCGGHCVYVDASDNKVRASKDCSDKEDRLFSITSSPPVEPLKPEDLLSGQIQIKSVKTGDILGVETIGNGANVYAKDTLPNNIWEVQPNTDLNDPFYFMLLSNNTLFKWDHKNGCHETDTNLIIWNKGAASNNKFYYSPKTQLITVCDGHCIYVDPSDKQVRATKDCSEKEDRYFSIASPQSSTTTSVPTTPSSVQTTPSVQQKPSVQPSTSDNHIPNPGQLLSGQVQIKSVKTGNVVGVDKAETGVNIFAKEGKQAYDVWDVRPNTNILDPYYLIQLANDAQYNWDHRNGCEETDTNIIMRNNKETGDNKRFYYNAITRLITVCNGHCVYVDPIDKKLRAAKDCSDKEDKYFYITSPQSSTTPSSVQPTPSVQTTPSVQPKPSVQLTTSDKPILNPGQLLSGQVQIKSVKTGHVVGVDKANTGVNIFVKEDKQAYDVWDVRPNTNVLDQYYLIQLANHAQYKWDHRNGCQETDTSIIMRNNRETGVNKRFYYNPITRLITVCNGHCVYVDPIDKKLRAAKDCSDKEDKYFYITVHLHLNLPRPINVNLNLGTRGGLNPFFRN